MKVNIDISILTENTSYGVVSGNVAFGLLPALHDRISLVPPPNETPIPRVHGFTGQLTVEARILHAGTESISVGIMLSDIVVRTFEDAAAVAKYFTEGFGLFVDVHEH